MQNQASIIPLPNIRFYRFFLIYFVLCIGVFGGITAYAMASPFLLLGRRWKWAERLGGRFLQSGLIALFWTQPWLKFQIRLDYPKDALGKPLPYFTLSNHRSHLDMFFLLYRIPNLRVIAKEKLFRVPFLAMIMRLIRNIPLKKGSIPSYLKAMKTALAGVLQGDKIHFFPEMTRCEHGYRGIQPFHLAVFQMAMKAKVLIVPIVFVGTDEAWPKGTFGISFRQPILIQSLSPIDPNAFETADALRIHVHHEMETFLCQHFDRNRRGS